MLKTLLMGMLAAWVEPKNVGGCASYVWNDSPHKFCQDHPPGQVVVLSF